MITRKRSQTTPAERRLRLLVLLFLIGLAIPLYILFNRVYSQLQQEALYEYRLRAENAVGLVDDDITRLMAQESNRPFADYGFFQIEAQQLLQTKDLTLSPLSQFPVSSPVPGLIGYFQISPAGTFSSPVLPDITKAELDAYNIQFSEDEYTNRLALKNRLERVLNTDQLLSRTAPKPRPKPRRDNEQRAPSVTPAAPAQERLATMKAEALKQTQKDAEPERDSASATSGVDLRSTFRGTKLAELNIDKRFYQRQQERFSAADDLADAPIGNRLKSDLKRQRKERIAIPESQSIEVYREFMKSKTPPQHKTDAQQTSPFVPQILSFEGEIDPLQLYILHDLTLVFVRKAWKAKQRYIQGFLVDGRAFIREAIQPRFHSSSIGSLSRLVVSYHNEVLAQIDPAQDRSEWRRYGSRSSPEPPPTDGVADALIYETSLSTPFHDITVYATVQSLPLGPGAAVVHMLAILIPAILLAGAFGLYRLAAQQIKLSAAQNNFVSAVSHELKTPLTSIRMYGEMLRAGWVQDEAKRQTYYDFIFSESERLSRLVANVLQLSRLTQNPVPLDLKPYSPGALLDLVHTQVLAQVESAGFTLDIHNHLTSEQTASAQIEVEEDAFTRIMINLVDNALKFSAQAEFKAVCLGVDMSGGSRPLIAFSVRDYGPGIHRQDRRKIFQRFYRAGSELTRATPGTGIGLALVKELASQMQAEVDVRNHQPGAEFRVVFQPARS